MKSDHSNQDPVGVERSDGEFMVQLGETVSFHFGYWVIPERSRRSLFLAILAITSDNNRAISAQKCIQIKCLFDLMFK